MFTLEQRDFDLWKRIDAGEEFPSHELTGLISTLQTTVNELKRKVVRMELEQVLELARDERMQLSDKRVLSLATTVLDQLVER